MATAIGSSTIAGVAGFATETAVGMTLAGVSNVVLSNDQRAVNAYFDGTDTTDFMSNAYEHAGEDFVNGAGGYIVGQAASGFHNYFDPFTFDNPGLLEGSSLMSNPLSPNPGQTIIPTMLAASAQAISNSTIIDCINHHLFESVGCEQ